VTGNAASDRCGGRSADGGMLFRSGARVDAP
jgi:hypothetical protein